MAGDTKDGLDYFPIDVNILRNIKVRKIINACGVNSIPVLISLLSNIYRDYGYFFRWDEYVPVLIADEIGIRDGSVHEIIKKAVQVEFFNSNHFNKYNILTSRGIQKRFLKVARRRKELNIIKEYWLIASDDLINVNINFIDVDRCMHDVDRCMHDVDRCMHDVDRCMHDVCNNSQTQKEKEKKEKEKKRTKKKEKEKKEKEILKDSSSEPKGSTAEGKKKKVKYFDCKSVEYLSAKYLADKILEKSPNARVPKDDKELNKWAIHVDYILRIDKRPLEEFKKVLKFATKDSFWSINILSTAKLREKYDQLYLKMEAKGIVSKDGDVEKNYGHNDEYKHVTSIKL